MYLPQINHNWESVIPQLYIVYQQLSTPGIHISNVAHSLELSSKRKKLSMRWQLQNYELHYFTKCFTIILLLPRNTNCRCSVKQTVIWLDDASQFTTRISFSLAPKLNVGEDNSFAQFTQLYIQIHIKLKSTETPIKILW